MTTTAPSKEGKSSIPHEGIPSADGIPSVRQATRRFFERDAARRQLLVRRESRRRIRGRRWAEAEPEHKVAVREACRRDPCVLFDDWLWTYDPRMPALDVPARLPFKLRPTQVRLVRWLEEREESQTSGLIEKSRDEGMTFVVLGFLLHHWLYVPGFAGAVGSRKQDLVDKLGDPKALFPKLRYMLYSLPAWMRPQGFSRSEHDNFLRITNPATGATITGEGGDNMGRGGRASLYFVDEWAFVERAEAVNAAISQNSNVRIKGTTPNGPGNKAYQERFGGKLSVFSMHWKDNPAKNECVTAVRRTDGADEGELVQIYPWYEKQKDELDEADLAQEVDVDWTASVRGVVIPAKWVRAAVGFEVPEGAERIASRGNPLHDPSFGHARRSGFDVAEEGSDDCVYVARRGALVARVEAWRGENTTASAHRARTYANEDEAQILFYDRVGVGAGVTGTMRSTQKPVTFKIVGVNNGERPTRTRYDDEPDVPADERFTNLGAELWWRLRRRFQKTYEVSEGIAGYPLDECISLPDRPALVAQLSQPIYSKTESGKIKVDKYGKGNARNSSLSSPDEAEALMYAFAEEEPELDYGRI